MGAEKWEQRKGNRFLDIQWYPGHMAKARRLLIDKLGRVDLVVELCDARLPISSRNPTLDQLIRGKRRVLLMCKADLAEQAKTKAWLRYFNAMGISVMEYDTTPAKTKQAKALIDSAAKEITLRAEQRGMKKTIRAMVVGVPNVGKSTFINRLYGGSIAMTGDRPGVTKAQQWVKVSPYLELLDTPGMLWPKMEDKLAAQRLAYIGTIKDAVYDQLQLSINLLEDLMRVMPERTMLRYKIKDASLTGLPLLEAVCQGRGFLMRGGEYDLDRGCAIVLDEFREGKVGRITLEQPPKEKKPEPAQPPMQEAQL